MPPSSFGKTRSGLGVTTHNPSGHMKMEAFGVMSREVCGWRTPPVSCAIHPKITNVRMMSASRMTDRSCHMLRAPGISRERAPAEADATQSTQLARVTRRALYLMGGRRP